MMEAKPYRGRGGSWRRGGGGESHPAGAGGEQRGRGRGGGGESHPAGAGGEQRGRGRGDRGGHHRGRGRRDHYRGRGSRGGRGGPAATHHQGRDEADSPETPDQEDEGFQTFSRRKLESNWDRYEAEEKEKVQEEGPTQRGADYHALLGSAGDSYTQFRLLDEKDWEADSSILNQMPFMLVDLPALAQSLQELPLHKRLNLDAELIQAATPEELPTVTLRPKQEANLSGLFRPPPAQQGPSGSLGVSSPIRPVSGTVGGTAVLSMAPVAACGKATTPADELDLELDVLLTLQTSGPDQSQSMPAPEDEMKPSNMVTSQEVELEVVPPVAEVETEAAKPEAEVEIEVKMETEAAKPEAKRQEVMEDDLEDWLDSMIS